MNIWSLAAFFLLINPKPRIESIFARVDPDRKQLNLVAIVALWPAGDWSMESGHTINRPNATIGAALDELVNLGGIRLCVIFDGSGKSVRISLYSQLFMRPNGQLISNLSHQSHQSHRDKFRF